MTAATCPRNVRRVIRRAVVAVLGVAAVLSVSQVPPAENDAQCRAVFGSLNDGICLDGPEPPAPVGPMPWVNLGPTGAGPGISTSPLLPGRQFVIPAY